MDIKIQKTIEDYSAIADLYIQDFGNDYLHFEVIDEVIQILKDAGLEKELKVDLGSGPGTIIKYLLEHNISNLKAVELVDKFYSYLVKTFEAKGVNILHSDMRSDIARRSSDSVGCYLAGYSLIHIPDEEIPNLFKNIHRTLKSKGIFFLSVQEGTYKGMEAEPYQTQKDKRFNSNEKFECYMNYFTEEELRKHLEQSGFTILKFYRFAQKPMPGELDVDKLWVIAQKRK